jgi:MurNAc alpha-1-phosphate uridylyltransferase
MQAMIFAAGLGTRMGALTEATPKALVPVKGRPLLGHVMDRLVKAGAMRIVVNTAHHGDQIAEWLVANTPAGVEIALSPEPGGPFDTGGGLIAAAKHFRGEDPILLHNVDVLSRIDLVALVDAHREARARFGDRVKATLAVQDRATSRKLVFDEGGLLGWLKSASGEERLVREPLGAVQRFGFSGIHVVEPAVLRLTERNGTFSILDLYLDLAAREYFILPHDVTGEEWLDVGTPERLREAERLV